MTEMAAMAPRVRLGRNANLVERIYVYRRGDALEIDTITFYRIARHRVLLEEVELITLHSQRHWRLLVLLGLLGLLIGSVAAAIWTSGPAAVAGALVLPLLGGIALGLALPNWVVTVQSRRTRARMAYGLREGKARAVVAEIARAVTDLQRRLSTDRPAPPASPFAPPP
ncbi:MAG TPA: hypothetical protein VN783_09235 [Thermoanaerobaculia bacterium]|nr:hypothetical protein [Thermoanaerobaculia bacterium]